MNLLDHIIFFKFIYASLKKLACREIRELAFSYSIPAICDKTRWFAKEDCTNRADNNYVLPTS